MPSNTTSSEQTFRHHAIGFLSRFLAYALPLLFFLVVTTFYLKTYDSAQIKITITQIGTTILLIAWFSKILLEGKFPFKKQDFVFVAPFIAFLASGLISYAHSPFKVWALEETLRRVFYMSLALITIAEMGSQEKMKRLWRWLMAAAWVSIGYGVLQYIDSRLFPVNSGIPGGIDPFIWRQAFGPRVFSTFGNPNFYGNFLVILTPLIFASILRGKGSLVRPFVVLVIMVGIVFLTDKMLLKSFGGFDPSFQVVFSVFILLLLGAFFWSCFVRVGASGTLPMFLVLFACLFLNLYSTETKGAWMGFIAAVSVTVALIIEFFFRLDEIEVDPKKYGIFIVAIISLYSLTMLFMIWAFVRPLFDKSISQVGFSILWIPTLIAGLVALVTCTWVIRKPWNAKKIVYAMVMFFVITMGAMVLQYAKTRLLSVSFRLFTWISTWEMIRTQPILGNGVGTFKVIYPAYRRPQIITLEGKSNTETDHAEDEYLEVWQDEGIIGFGIFLWMICTALFCGFKQLNWFSRIRGPTILNQKKSLMNTQADPRSYEVLGILGAYIGALFHWFVDVSIRFVSSGVFSGLLPGLLVAYARNHENPVVHDDRTTYERWIRASVAAVWTAVFLYLRLELVPNSMVQQTGETTFGQIAFFCVLAGLFIFGLLELLEMGNEPTKLSTVSVSAPASSKIPLPARLGILLVVMFFGFKSIRAFAHHFQADVHHNLAIFFSKNAIWTKAPRYEEQIMKFPEDIRKVYRRIGGALENYAEVIRKNPAFPMAIYFTGNVYNDWGSQQFQQSLQARAAGDSLETNRLKESALDMWKKSEDAYQALKKIAPNYVQKHHQMGLLYVKKAELASQFGDASLAKQHYQTAFQHFSLYHELDPVFPPNYDRMVQILLMENKFDESIALYKKAIYYNEDVAKVINVEGYPHRVADLSLALGKLIFTRAQHVSSNPYLTHKEDIEQAIFYFKKSTENNPSSAEAWKALGFILTKSGRGNEAQAALQKALQLSPNDPDLKRSGQ